MNNTEAILSHLFKGTPSFISNINCYNRNSISVYSIHGKKILFKKFNKKEFIQREKFFYKFLKNSCKIPKIYSEGEDFIITEFIESCKPNLIQAVRDWAKIHSNFLENEILENPLMFKHKSRNLSDYILNYQKMFGKSAEKIKDFLSSKEREKNYSTLIHGDLFGRNILTKNGENYYIDFEFSGSGHPVKDLSLLLLNNPNMKEEIIKIYRKNISFDYEKIEEDIKKELLNKGTQLILGLGNLKMSLEGKKKIHKKFLGVMENYLEK